MKIKILLIAAAAAAALWLAGCGGAGRNTAQNPGNEESAEAVFASAVKMDTHLHVDVPMEKKNMPGPKVDLRAAMKNLARQIEPKVYEYGFLRR